MKLSIHSIPDWPPDTWSNSVAVSSRISVVSCAFMFSLLRVMSGGLFRHRRGDFWRRALAAGEEAHTFGVMQITICRIWRAHLHRSSVERGRGGARRCLRLRLKSEPFNLLSDLVVAVNKKRSNPTATAAPNTDGCPRIRYRLGAEMSARVSTAIMDRPGTSARRPLKAGPRRGHRAIIPMQPSTHARSPAGMWLIHVVKSIAVIL